MTNRVAAGNPSHNGHAPAGDPALVFAELMPEAGLAGAPQLIAAVNLSERDCYAPSIGEIDNDPASGWNFLVRLAERVEEMGAIGQGTTGHH